MQPPDLLARIASTPVLLAAFDRVRNNHGCAGADGVSLEAYDRNLKPNLAALEGSLSLGAYRPFPLLRILVDRGDGSARQLLIPTVRDRIAQAAALHVLGPLFEAAFEACSFGYRRGRSVRDAVRQIKACYEQGYHWVAEADIDAYFDSVDHGLLLRRVRELLRAGAGVAADPTQGPRRSPPVIDAAGWAWVECIQTSLTRSEAFMGKAWQLQRAKAELSRLIDVSIEEGPQTVTRHGRPTAVVMSTADYRKLKSREPDFKTFLRKAALYELDLTRSRDRGRKVHL